MFHDFLALRSRSVVHVSCCKNTASVAFLLPSIKPLCISQDAQKGHPARPQEVRALRRTGHPLLRAPVATGHGYVEGIERRERSWGAFFSVLLGLGVELDQPLPDGQDGGLRAVIDL